MFLLFAVLVLRNRGKPVEKHTRPPYWAAWVFDKVGRLAATIHDVFMVPVFGSGRCSTPQQQLITRMKIEELLKAPLSEEDHQKCREAEVDKEPAVLKAAEKIVESVAE
jgi:hypothetical protein